MQTKFEEIAPIVRQEEIADDIYSMWIEAKDIAEHARAGQFLSVYSNDGSRLLPRPISICEIDREKGRLRLVYRVAGKGTKEFSDMHAATTLKVMGPLGNGFPKKEKKAFLIEKNMPKEGMLKVLDLAKKERAAGRQVMIMNMKKNKKFQKEQLAEQGYTDITECYRDSVDNL